MSSSAVDKRRVGVKSGEMGENGGRNVMVDEGDGVTLRKRSSSGSVPLSCMRPSSLPIQHNTSATKTTSSHSPAASNLGSI